MEETNAPTSDQILLQLLQQLAVGQQNVGTVLQEQHRLFAQLSAPRPTQKPKSRLAPPEPYDGSAEKLDSFLRQLYLSFSDDPEYFSDHMRKVRFALSYMKSKFALQWATRVIGELENGTVAFASWAEFHSSLSAAFMSANKKEQAQRKLELLRQNNRAAEEYFVEFEEYKAVAGYNDEGYVALLKRNLNSGIVRRIYELERVPTTYAKWKEYALRFDQNYREYQALVGQRRADGNGPPRNSDRRNPFPTQERNPFPRPNPRPPPPRPEVPKTDFGQPMDVDRTQATVPETRECYNCGAKGHLIRNCPKSRVEKFRSLFDDLSEAERAELRGLYKQDF